MDKRGTWTWADTLYWFFYIPITAFTIIALVVIPSRVMGQIIQPIPLDASIMQERFTQKATAYSPVLGSRQGEITADFAQRMRLALSDKRYGYNVSYSQNGIVKEQAFGNKDFYEQAVPLAPIKYDRYVTQKNLTKDGQIVTLTIDQTFPKKYEARRAT